MRPFGPGLNAAVPIYWETSSEKRQTADGNIQRSCMPTPSIEPQPQTGRSERAFSYKIQAGFWLVGAILLFIGLASYQSIREFDETVDWVAHSQEVLGRLQVVLSDVQDIEIGLRGYLMTGKENFLDPYKTGLDVVGRDREALSTIMQVTPQDTPEQSRNIELLNALIDKKLVLLKTVLALRKDVSYQ